jgi:hypothetical protein
MKRLGQIQVEPLSDQRWAKIERSLTSRLALEANDTAKSSFVRPPRRVARTWLLAAALLSALGGVAFAVRGLPQRPVVEQPSRITTGANASHLALSGLSLDIEPDSAVVVGAETPQGLLIVVDRGSIACQVAPRSSDAPLIVQAGAVRVRVVGTRFSLTRLGESARVKVHEGVVEVSSRGGSWRLRAGEEWPIEARRTASPNAVEAPATASVPRAVEAQRKGPATEPVAPVAPRIRVGSAHASPAVPEPSPQALFEEATALERSNPERAAELYGGLESGSDSWAQNALYARGRLQASRGNRAEARRLLELYLERFPNGSNAEDARAVLKRLR